MRERLAKSVPGGVLAGPARELKVSCNGEDVVAIAIAPDLAANVSSGYSNLVRADKPGRCGLIGDNEGNMGFGGGSSQHVILSGVRISGCVCQRLFFWRFNSSNGVEPAPIRAAKESALQFSV